MYIGMLEQRLAKITLFFNIGVIGGDVHSKL